MSQSLIQILKNRASQQPQKIVYNFLVDGEKTEDIVTYKQMHKRAMGIAAYLQGLNAARERALLLYPPGIEYISAFLGCLYSSVIAVPVYPPDPSRLDRTLPRLLSIASDAHPKVVLTTLEIANAAKYFFLENSSFQNVVWIATDKIDVELSHRWKEPEIDENSIAFLQYTSGSTADPKGVMLTHKNLLHNLSLINNAFENDSNSHGVIWLPPYHDMGLIGGILQPLYVGSTVTLLSPLSFLQKPVRWLQTISNKRADISGGPNFAYDLCVRKITDQQKEQLDLSSWRLAFNGAEPIRAETIDNFVKKFEPCGFRKEAFYTCYGLAEATLIVSGGKKAVLPKTISVKKFALEHQKVELCDEQNDDKHILVGSGVSTSTQKIAIVDIKTFTELGENSIGEVWVSGDSVALGYWNRPQETTEMFQAYKSDNQEVPFLRTGDLGFIDNNELYITGRLKDLIILRGLNYYPQDIEKIVEYSSAFLRQGCCAAFSVEMNGTEELVLVAELEKNHLPIGQKDVAESSKKDKPVYIDCSELVANIRQAVARSYEIQIHTVYLIKSNSILKTSSGKIQRQACKKAFLEHSFDVLHQSALKNEVLLGQQSSISYTSILNTKESERKELIEKYICIKIANVMKKSLEEIKLQSFINQISLDSIMVIELKYQIESELHIELPFAIFFQQQTVSEIVDYILSQFNVGNFQEKGFLQGSLPQQPFSSLSYGQQALWFINELAPESAAYNVSFAVLITSELNKAALKEAFQTIINRHSSLRTTFIVKDNNPLQQVHNQAELYLQDIDALGWTQKQTHMWLTDEAKTPFDLKNGPIMRISLLNRGYKNNILLINVHHIAIDLWSLVIIVDELALLYKAKITGIAPSVLLPKLEYVDYTKWQLSMLDSQEGKKLSDYWQKQLAGELPFLELPIDKPRPSIQTYNGATVGLHLGEDLTYKIKELSNKEHSTIYATLLATFQILLYRYTYQKNIVVGSPSAGRNKAGLENIVGYFVNPIAIKAELSEDLSFKDFLLQVKGVVLEALEHANYPFSLLVEKLQPNRDPSRSAIFQAMFILQKPHRLEQISSFTLGEREEQNGSEIELGMLKFKSLALEHRVSQFDLSLIMAESERKLLGVFEYNTDLFERSTIERLASHYQKLLESIVVNPLLPISQLEMLTIAQKNQLIIDWNLTHTEYPRNKTINQLIEEQVERTPDKLAVVFEAKALTYEELNTKANRLANYLLSIGVGLESFVGLYTEPSIEMVVAIIGILKAGGAYIPLDPNYPQDRLEFILKDSKINLIITQEIFSDRFSLNKVKLIFLDKDQESFSKESNPNKVISPKNAAYIIYTSGSRGTPKGIVIEHQSLVNHALSIKQIYKLSNNDRVLQFSSINFDVSAEEIYPTLISGARLYIRTKANIISPENLLIFIKENNLTVLNLPTPFWHELVTELEVSKNSLPKSLRLVIIGSDKIILKQLNSWIKIVGDGVSWCNAYGLTESTITSTIYLPNKNTEYTLSVPIGQPIKNTEVFILDFCLQPVPIGVTGELYIAGNGLARGYLNKPDLTAETFIPNPFSNKLGERLCRTGDLARWLPNGEIDLIGRVDYQVKIRGFRIELGEIESVLSQHVAIKDSIVTVYKDAFDNLQIVAYLVSNLASDWTQIEVEDKLQNARAGVKLNIDQPQQVLIYDNNLSIGKLRSFLKTRLPDYMLPSAFVFLDKLPLLPNGKIDRRSLPNPTFTKLQGLLDLPETLTQRKVAKVWLENLNLEHVGIHSNFFELGGHSLLAIKLVARLNEAFTSNLQIRDIFEFPTIAEISRKIDTLSKIELLISLNPNIDRFSASFAQEWWWFLEQINPANPAYNLPGSFWLKGKIDVNILKSTINELILRQQSLRTNFKTIDGKVMAVVHSNIELNVSLTDIQYLPKDQRLLEAQKLAKEHIVAPFDLENEPLIRVSLIHFDLDTYILLLAMHHIISDGWSVAIFSKELISIYDALTKKQASKASLPEKFSIQYSDYTRWQRQNIDESTINDNLAYWKHKLSNLSVLNLPVDIQRQNNYSFNGKYVPFTISLRLTNILKRLVKEKQTTLFIFLLTVFKTLLLHYSGQEDIVVGTVITERNQKEFEQIIGNFTSNFILRTNISGNPKFSETLKQIQETVIEGYKHKEVPLRRLFEELYNNNNNQNKAALAQITFILHTTLLESIERFGLRTEPFEFDIGTTQAEIHFNLWEGEYDIKGICYYSSDLFNRNTIERMLIHYQTILEKVALDSSQRLLDIPLLTSQERTQLVFEWNLNQRLYPKDLSIDALFKLQVGINPNAVAVIFQGKQLTYAQLNKKANHLARKLIKAGVGTETLVGISVQRSMELIIGLLAILKAGGAYLPLDTSYPQQRLLFMLEDANVKIVIGKEIPPALINHKIHFIKIEPESEMSQEGDDINSNISPKCLAYVMYTSGSTGKPKGVAVTHKNIVRLVKNINYVNFEEEVILQFASISFDASTFEIWGALLNGSTLVVYPPEMPSLEELGDFIFRNNITTLWLTVGLFQQMVDSQLEKLKGVKQLLAGGDILSAEHVKKALSVLTSVKVINGYGPTENTTFTCCYNVERARLPLSSIPIGKPISNTAVYILNKRLEPVAVGIAGELYIAGDGLSRGYINKPDLTAECFIPDHLSGKVGKRLYKTGDLTRWRCDGNIEFLGRIDTQVKIRGFRVELQEIENTLSSHPSIASAIVIAKQNKSADKKLIAYVVLKQGYLIDLGSIKTYLADRLPSYMCPTVIIPIESIPLTSNGKVDKAALPDIDSLNYRDIDEDSYIAPRTYVEKELAAIWCEVLNINKVGINDSFFEIGGHSLLLTRLASRISHKFNVDIPLKVLFDTPTIVQMTSAIAVRQIEQDNSEDLDEIITDLENLTDAELQMLLDNEIDE